jgi:predicted phage tail protein
MGRQLSHLLGATGMTLVVLLWLSLLSPRKADLFVDSLAGSQHEYKIVLGAAMLATVFAFVAAVRGSNWWYLAVVVSSGTLAFFTFSLSR